jgi:hypothetical protein
VANASQLDSDADGIGNVCDTAPGVPDGHNHSVTIASHVKSPHAAPK